MYTYTWYQWLSFFFIYCFFGWIIESAYVSLKSRCFVNRGFLRLPLLPLYGSGAIIMLWVALPVKHSIALVFLLGMIAASALEYVTGWGMEKLFLVKYWDYSANPFNLHGYICLGTSIAWGFLSVFLMEIVHKPIEYLVMSTPEWTNIVFVSVVGVLFAADAFESTKEALSLSQTLEAMTKLRSELDEIQLQMALLKAETVSRLADLRDEQIERAAGLIGEAELKLFELRKGVHAKAASVAELSKFKLTGSGGSADKPLDLSVLTERLASLTEARSQLAEHLGFYKKGLLRSNPTASSKQFGEALRELKEALAVKRNKGSRRP